MSIFQILQLVSEVLDLLRNAGLLNGGKLTIDFANLHNDASFISSLDEVLVKNNVKVPGQVDTVLKIISALVG